MLQTRLTALPLRHPPRLAPPPKAIRTICRNSTHTTPTSAYMQATTRCWRLILPETAMPQSPKRGMAEQDEIAALQVGKQGQVIPTFGQRRPIKHRCQYLKDITQSRQTAETKDLNKTTIAAIPGHSGGGYRYLITIRIRPNSMPSKSAWRAHASCHIRPLTPCRQPHWCRGGDPVGCGCANTR